MRIVVLILLLSNFVFGFRYFVTHSLKEFPHFKIYKPNDDFLKSNLSMPKGKLKQEQIDELLYIYEKEKMVRDMLLVLNEKYHYNFMIYISILTQKHLTILDMFFKKYNIKSPKYKNIVGMYENRKIEDEYQTLLLQSIKNKSIAGNLSVKFMTELIHSYKNIIKSNPPRDIKRELLKLNAFNKKVLRKFKRGLRNVEIGLPIE